MIVNSWDEKRERVFRVTQEYFDNHISTNKHFGGNLSLYGMVATSLGELERVEGCLNVDDTEMTSLGNLVQVKGFLSLERVNLTSLGKLETVGDEIYCTEGSDTHKLLMNSIFSDQLYVVDV